ncbi:Dabb family protein [Microbaculum marinum]|uniref:Dabb family protein n=1 Tax=Microbaculum marinum TaxID=1764581 RepID=A0AAW9RR54_9HYPH
MIKHFVAFRFKPEVPPDEQARVLDELNEFPSRFPAMKNWSLGRNISRRDDTFSHAFVVEFDREDELLSYLNSEEHEQFVATHFRPFVATRGIVSLEIPDPR